MQKFTQKYTIVHLVNEHPNGFEYTIENWPVHITLADIFAIDGKPEEVLEDLSSQMASIRTVKSQAVGDDWFGEDRSIHVQLLEITFGLQQLHESILKVLENFNAKFNNPQYIKEGFKPHLTIQKDGEVERKTIFTIDTVTLIDMFPSKNPYKRRVLGTIHLHKA